MADPASPIYEFGDFRLDVAERRLWQGEEALSLPPKLFDTLALLVRDHGRLVEKDAFMRAVWPDANVSEATLAHNISDLRKLLGHADAAPVIETVSKKGYRFVAPVREAGPPARGQTRVGDVSDPRLTPPPAAALPVRRRRFPIAALAAAFIVIIAVAGYVATRWRSAAVSIHSVLVLPLDNLSPQASDAYLADGMTEALTTELARIPSLRVISRTTGMQYKRDRKPLAQIGRDLDVDAVVEGSVARIGQRIRVTVQLIQIDPERHLWADVYDRDLADAFTVQSDVTRAVADAIHVKLTPEDRARLGQRRAVRADANDAYLKARYFESGAAGLATERAIEEYKRAVDLDPGFTAARAGLARAYIFGVRMRPKAALAIARETALKALEGDPDSPDALLASAITRLYYDRDLAGAAGEFRRAIDAAPGNVDAHFYSSQCLAAMGRFDEAIASAGRALRLDPRSPLIAHYAGRIHYFARHYDKAIAALEAALDVDPNYAFTHIFLASTYERMRQYDKALEHRQTYLTLNEATPEEVAQLGALARTSGYNAALRKWAETAEAGVAARGYTTSSELVYVLAEMGQRDEAIRWLERAVEDHVRDLIYVNVEPGFDPLRADPRFVALARRAIP